MIRREIPGDDQRGRIETAGASNAVSFGPYLFNDRARSLQKEGAQVKIGSRALDLLGLLVSRAGEVISKSELMAHAWPGLAVDEISLRVHIAELRKALGDGKDGTRYINNVPSRGYCFVASIERSTTTTWAPSQGNPDELGVGSLPPRLERMIGRDDVLSELANLLAKERFITLRGPGGIGKTTVAVALAHNISRTFDDQVYFVDLGPLKDAELVASTVASTLKLAVQHADPTESIVNFLRNRRLLLVLDSCEHVIETAARITEYIYQQVPGVSIVVTSRESLLVEGVHIFEIVPLAGPPHGLRLSLDQAVIYPAAHLFVERAAASGHRSSITDDEVNVLVEICNKLDGIPLAIELAAVRVGAHGLREMAGLLDGRLKLEWRGRRTAPPRHQTLGATLDWSCGLISENERVVLRRLSIFAGSFTLEGAIEVASDDSGRLVVDALSQLVAKSLLSARATGWSTRYRLLDVTRAYAMQKLVASDELKDISRRHALYVRHSLEKAILDSNNGDQASRSRDRGELLGDARTALTWAYTNDDCTELQLALACACTRLFIDFNLLNEGRQWASRALSVLDDASRGGRWELELNSVLGHALMFTERNSEQAEEALKRALALSLAAEDRFNQFRLLSRLNMFYRRTGDYSRLLPIALQAEQVARTIGDAAGIAGAKALVGVSYHLAGNQHAAQRHLEDGLLGIESLRGTAPGHFAYSRTPQIPLSRVLWLRGLPDRAVECVRPLMGAAAPKDAVMHTIALCWAASVFGWIGDWSMVESLTARLTAHTAAHGLASYEAVASGFQAQTLIASGDMKAGVELLWRVLPRLHADRYELYASSFAADLSQGLAALGEVSDGLSLLCETIDRVTPEGDSFDMPELLRLRGMLEMKSGDADRAEESLAASIALAEQQGALSWRLRGETTLAQIRRDLGKPSPFTALADTYARFSEGFDTADLRAAKRLLDTASSQRSI